MLPAFSAYVGAGMMRLRNLKVESTGFVLPRQLADQDR
jgi:hypothetical protein